MIVSIVVSSFQPCLLTLITVCMFAEVFYVSGNSSYWCKMPPKCQYPTVSFLCAMLAVLLADGLLGEEKPQQHRTEMNISIYRSTCC